MSGEQEEGRTGQLLLEAGSPRWPQRPTPRRWRPSKERVSWGTRPGRMGVRWGEVRVYADGFGQRKKAEGRPGKGDE